MINRFNLDGAHNFWGQVTANVSGKLNTWAIFWYATIFEHNGLCLNPTVSYVQNIGLDGSGENCGQGNLYRSCYKAVEIRDMPNDLEESSFAVEKIQDFYSTIKPSLLKKF